MAVILSPVGGVASQFFDNNGIPLSGGKMYTYVAGTTTPQATYTSSSGVTAHTNPIILDSGGRVPGGEIWLTTGLLYKFVLKTSTDVLIGTYDNVSSIVNASVIPYQPAGTGAVVTTVQTKLRESVSVLDFGAVGDGVTDNTAAFNLALVYSKNVIVPAGTYLLKGTVNVALGNQTLQLFDSAILIGSSSGTYTSIPTETTAYALVKLSGISARITGGTITLTGTSNMAGIYSSNYQQHITQVRVNGGAYGVYANNHSCTFTYNIFNSCITGMKGISSDFNGNSITFNDFESCTSGLVIFNASTGQVNGVFINNNLFNLYTAVGIYCNCVNQDFQQLVISGNYFEYGSASCVAISLSGIGGSFSNVSVRDNLSFGDGSTTSFLTMTVLGSLIVQDNTFFNHAYGVSSSSSGGQFICKGNIHTGTVSPYVYQKVAPFEIDDLSYSTGASLVRSSPQVYAQASVYDIGAQMSSSTTTLTDITGASSLSGNVWAATTAPALSIFTNKMYANFKFDVQMKIGDGWQAELVCRLNPTTPANYYRIGIRQSGATYTFCLFAYGATVTTNTSPITTLPSANTNWGMRGWFVGQYCFIQTYDSVTGTLLDTASFTDSSYSIGRVGMYTNSLHSGNEAYVKQTYIGPN